MVEEKTFRSALKMHHLVFDEISFKRLGFQQESDEIENEISMAVNKDQDEDLSLVTLEYSGRKPGEYIVTVRLTGYFEIEGEVPEEERRSFLQVNGVAIMFPYLRAELSLITAQPETTPLVMPPYNINAMLAQAEKEN